jgi:hypothetical protein
VDKVASDEHKRRRVPSEKRTSFLQRLKTGSMLRSNVGLNRMLEHAAAAVISSEARNPSSKTLAKEGFLVAALLEMTGCYIFCLRTNLLSRWS